MIAAGALIPDCFGNRMGVGGRKRRRSCFGDSEYYASDESTWVYVTFIPHFTLKSRATKTTSSPQSSL